MALDPLSETTRTTKRNLLIAAVLAITYRAFEVTIDRIPVAGVVIDFNKGVFAFLLVVVLLYLLIAFSVYYFIDIKNFETPSHRTKSDRYLAQALEQRIARFVALAQKDANEVVPTLVKKSVAKPPHVSFGQSMNSFVADYLASGRSVRKQKLKTLQPSDLYSLIVGAPYHPVGKRADNSEAYDYLDRFVVERIPRIVSFERVGTFFSRRRHTAVTFTYALRNYVLDGLLPMVLGVIALLAMYHGIPLGWLRHVAPPQ